MWLRGLREHDVAREESNSAAEAGTRRQMEVPRKELLTCVLDARQFSRSDRRKVVAELRKDVATSCHGVSVGRVDELRDIEQRSMT